MRFQRVNVAIWCLKNTCFVVGVPISCDEFGFYRYKKRAAEGRQGAYVVMCTYK